MIHELRIGKTYHRLIDARIPWLPSSGQHLWSQSKAIRVEGADERLAERHPARLLPSFVLGIRDIRACIASPFITTYRRPAEPRLIAEP